VAVARNRLVAQRNPRRWPLRQFLARIEHSRLHHVHRSQHSSSRTLRGRGPASS